MSVSLTFHTLSERKPEHGQSIVYFRRRMDYDFVTFEPKETTVEYSWFEYEDGDFTGCQICYEPEEANNPEILATCKLEILLAGGECMDDKLHFWMSAEEWDAAFPMEEGDERIAPDENDSRIGGGHDR